VPTPRPFERVRYVLVQPTLAANIGAAARAIKTMGFGRLVVVDPRAFRTAPMPPPAGHRRRDVLQPFRPDWAAESAAAAN
jgi:tRNA C32,U32 (ribose-2'-O)-methylase TrmJ